MSRVLVVEDDADISEALEYNLRTEGFETEVALLGATALRKFREFVPDLVLLDLMLPDIPGLEVCREIRRSPERSATPIVMLTAKGAESERLLGLESGADDYIVKPFSNREVLLRVRAILRRTTRQQPRASVAESSQGLIRIDQESHRVFVDGEEAALTHTEFKLLALFLERRGVVLSRRQLLDQVWNMPGGLVTRTVDTHIKRLREKLGPAGACIETVRSVGYRYSA